MIESALATFNTEQNKKQKEDEVNKVWHRNGITNTANSLLPVDIPGAGDRLQYRRKEIQGESENVYCIVRVLSGHTAKEKPIETSYIS